MMGNKGKQIKELLNTMSVAAPDVTRPLKDIGNGNMLTGVKNIFNFALEEGEKSGFLRGEKIGKIKGSVITLGVCGIIYIIPKGVNLLKKKKAEKETHDEMEEKIYTAFSQEISANSSNKDEKDSEE